MSSVADRKTHWVQTLGAGSHLGVGRSRSSPGLGRIAWNRAKCPDTQTRTQLNGNQMKVAGLVLVASLVAVTGCGPHWFLRTTIWEPAPVAILTNDNVTIRSDGWELRSGEVLRIEDGPGLAYYRAAAGRHDGFLDFHEGTAYMGCAFDGFGDELLSAYRTDVSFDIGRGNQVTVEREVSGIVESYHGIIVFMPIIEGADEIARRRWQVSIPDRYFASARGGGISVVYGTYDAAGSATRGVCGKSSVQPVSWVLWFSDIPLLEE